MVTVDSKDCVIELKDLSFGYSPGHPVLRNLNFRLKRSEKTALTGANGAGKTTLFHLIMGLLRPAFGTINIFGRERRRKGDFLEVRRRIGYLFQDSDDQLFCPTVAEDIAFGPFNLGKSREEVKRIIPETLGLLGLVGFEERITYKLSGGEKRLVALGTVLAMDPDVLLLDEPVIGLDKEHRERFVEILKMSPRAYIIISHDRDFLSQVTSSVGVLSNGTITQ